MRADRPERGQATVELALALPVVVLVSLILAQAVVIGRDRLLVAHAAREAARAAAVEPDAGVAFVAASGAAVLDRGRLDVRLSGGRREGDTLVVEVVYRAPTEVPLVGRLVGDVELRDRVAVRVEETG